MTNHELIEIHKEECKKEWPRICVPWPSPRQWIMLIGIIFASVVGTVWTASNRVTAITTEIVNIAGKSEDHAQRLKALELHTQRLMQVEQNTNKIIKLLEAR